MSLSSVTTLAVARDATPAGDEVPLDDQQATWGKALVAAIPTEVLAVYTAVLGAASSLATVGAPDAYLPFRFAWYAVGLAATPAIAWLLFRRKANAHPDVDADKVARWGALRRPEIVAPTLAAAAWFTAMPGSPWQIKLSSGAFTLTSIVATAAGALVVGLITPTMTKPTP